MPFRRYTTKEERRALASVELERARFLQILALNPNYFGTLADSPLPTVKPIKSSTVYEELGCIGYHPQREELHATVVVKQPYGYNGSAFCGGSPEHVRFYLQDGAGNWVDQGIVSFTAYNVPEGTEGHRDLDYAVTLKIDPARKLCYTENLVRVRAILSWKTPPPANQPDWPPVWGEVQEADIQIDKRPGLLWADLGKLDSATIPADLFELVDEQVELPFKPPKALTLQELHLMYKDTDVEPKRYLTPMLESTLHQLTFQDALTLAGIDQPLVDVLPGLEIDWGDLLNIGDGDISYEELTCVGLDTTEKEMVGIIHVKKKSGYSGDLCSSGSKQYVAFWVDRDLNGNYEFLGIGNVNVYDLSTIPEDGLHYAVSIPVDVDKYRAQCGDEDVVWRVRAILSWNTPPPSNNPHWTPTWGNREEVLVSLDPARVANDGTIHDPVLESVGGIDPYFINTQGFANGPMVANPGAVANQSPFGGLVTLRGYLLNSLDISALANPDLSDLKYKVRVRPQGGAWETVGNSFNLNVKVIDITTGFVNTITRNQQVDGDGFYTYREDLNGDIWWRPVGNILSYWYTGGREGDWEIQVIAKLGMNQWSSAIVPIHLDNTAPTIELDYANACGDVIVGDTIAGQYTAFDKYLRRVHLVVEPTAHANAGQWLQPPAPTNGASTNQYYPVTTMTAPDTRTWEFNTTGMDPCGYVLKAWAYDRTIVNNVLHGRRANDVIGFCLRK